MIIANDSLCKIDKTIQKNINVTFRKYFIQSILTKCKSFFNEYLIQKIKI